MQVETFHYDLNEDNKCITLNFESKLDKCIQSIVKKEGYISCDIRKKVIPADGGNYLAVLYEVDVKGETTAGNKETAIFVKSMVTYANNLEVISLPGVYKTELFVYKELIQIYNELQDEANIPASERYNTVKCYEESYDEAIIMENVTRKGFKTWYRMDVITLDMAEECIKQLGRFHGLSFVLEQRKPDYFSKKIKTLKYAHNFGPAWDKFVEKFNGLAMERLEKGLRSKVENKILQVLNKVQEYFKDQSIRHCLCHGDFRPNNILHKEVDGKITEVVTVDYQLVYFGCPVLDFLYLIYMATDRQFRSSHLVYLKDLYYKSLDQFLRHFDMSAESVLPRKVFENLYDEKFDYGIMIAVLFYPFLFVSEEEEMPDLVKEAVDEIEFKLDDRIIDRLNGAIEEFVELGYF